MLSGKNALNLSNGLHGAKNMQQRLSHVLQKNPAEPVFLPSLSGSLFCCPAELSFESVIDWSWVNPIMQCVAEPCGQTAVDIRVLISIPGEQL